MSGWWRQWPAGGKCRIRAAPGRHARDYGAWIQGQSPAAGVDLPAAQGALEHVYVAALGMSPRAQVSFCVFFRDRGVKLVEFTQELNFDVTQSQSAPECVP